MNDDVYEVHAIKYARLMRRSPENYIGGHTKGMQSVRVRTRR
jgi:hypothetical protein